MIVRKSLLAMLVTLCTLTVGVMSWSASALAASARQFITPASPDVESESTIDVSATSATLQAQINPLGSETTYYFQYGTEAGAYTASVPTPPGTDIGSGEAGQPASVHLQDLQPATTYHYRVVASGQAATVDGQDHSFTTQAPVSAASLPDGRAYELVSPPNKHGAEAINLEGYSGNLEQATEDGGAMAYAMRIPPEADAPANGFGTTLLSRRGADGWSTENLSSPLVEPTEAQTGTEFIGISADGSRSVLQLVRQPGNVQNLSPEAPLGVRTLPFVRYDDGTYRPLATEAESGSLPGAEIVFEGAAPDLNHIVVASRAGLLPPTASTGRNLYEWADGRLRPVSVLPDGSQAGGQSWLGLSGQLDPRHAISDDGSHVIWSNEGLLYERDMVTEQTVSLPGRYFTASSNGMEVFSGEPAGELYAFNAQTDHVTDVAPQTELLGVLGASVDGTDVYFAARGNLAAGATAGAANLYSAHNDGSGWSVTFVATLAEGDHADWASYGEVNEYLASATARVSANGRYVAFMSSAGLTGYDNTDAHSAQPDAEVYVYDAASARLTCASCNPTGARPEGEFNESDLAMAAGGIWNEQWLSATVPGWMVFSFFKAMHQPRYLSDEGRLFFDSAEALVPQDTNGREDVYEFEPAGVGSCEQASGCVSLISGGAGNQDSSFIDASNSGEDVFFITSERLVPQDTDEAFDMYDARVCSSAAPCATTFVTAPPCASSDACKAAPASQPGVFGAPPSATFSGAGNIVAPKPVSAVKKKTVRKSPKKKRKPRRKTRRKAKAVRRTKRSNGHSTKGSR